MRTHNLIKKISATMLAALVFVGAQAQLTTNRHLTPGAFITDTTTVGEQINYVTESAIVPFGTESTLPIWQLQNQGILTTSVWKWTTIGGPGGITIYAADGMTPLTPVTIAGQEDLTGQGWVEDSVVGIEFLNTGGPIYLRAQERTVSNISGMAGCEGDWENLTVRVVIRPTIVFNDADRILGGCGADVTPNNDIPITVSGNGLFSATGGLHITYRIDYTNLSGSTTPGISTTINDGDEFNTGWAQFSVNQGPTNTVIPFNIPDGQYGTYAITLEAITDEISRKTLHLRAGYDLEGLPPVGQRILTYYALPTPNTQPIKHIRNIGW